MRRNCILQALVFLALVIPSWLFAQTSNPSEKGEWTDIIPMPIVSVASSNLPNGKVLVWSAYDRFRFGGNRGKTYTVIFDPVTNKSEEFLVSDTKHDMFCPGTANLADGRVMVTGGSSSPKTSIYDPFTEEWSSSDNMNIPRGYHSMVTLSNGDVFTIGGSWSGGRGNKHSEIWDSKTGTWSKKDGIPVSAMGNSSDYHAWLWQAPNGKLFHAGPTKEMHWIDYSTPQGSYSSAGSREANDHGFSGAIVMYDKGKILKMGGASSFSGGQLANGITTIIDINSDDVKLRQVESLNIPRALHNATVLPTGEVFVSGGLKTARYFSDKDARLIPEIWNPNTERWTELAPMQVPRNYHSTSVLLPDGRVMLAGGGLCGSCKENHPDAEIYSPPYLFKSNGELASRPEIKAAPEKAPQGSVITINTNRAISYFSIIRYSSNTHSTNNEQRRIQLPATRVGHNQYQVTIPDPNVAVPGYYMLFGIDGNGVPSVAHNIMLDPSAPAQDKCEIEEIALEYHLNGSGWRRMAGTTFTVKAGDKLYLSSNPNGMKSYVWNGPNGFTKNGNRNGDILLANEIQPNMSGEYEVTLTYNNGCVKKKSFTLNVLTPPSDFFAHWKLDGDAKDAIGDAHGQIKGGAQLVNDPIRGKVLSISKNGDHVHVPAKPQMQVGTGGQDFSVAFWMKLTQDHTGKWRTIMHKGSGVWDRTFAMWMRPHDNRIHFRIGTTHNRNEGGNSNQELKLDTWTHVAYVHKGKKLRLYINGVLDQSVPLRGVVLSNDADLYIGDSPWYQPALGQIDDVRLYGHAIAGEDPNEESELKALAQPTHFFAHWKLDTGAKDAIGDAHGQFKNGATLVDDDERGKVLAIAKNKQHVLVTPKDQLQVGMLGNDFTVAFWMNLKEGHTGRWRSVLHKGLNPRDRTFAMWMRPHDNRLHFRISTSHSWNEGSDSKTSIPLNAWTHIAYVKDGNKLKLYINGKLDRTVNLRGTTRSNNANLYIGGSPWYNTALSNMDDVRLFGYALNDDQVLELTPACEASGLISASYWYDVPGGRVDNIPLNKKPNEQTLLPLFETPSNTRDNYAARVSGYLCPPVTGEYTFWIASDDNGELYISSDEKPENKVMVAHVPGWTASRQYDKYAAQRSVKISLVAGQKYYVEALMNEGGGGDNLSVGWQLPDGTLERPIMGDNLSPFLEDDKLTQSITFQAIDDKKKTSGDFTLIATASSKLPLSFSLVSGPATVTGNRVSLTGEKGLVKIKAYQAGNASFAAAEAFQEFNVVEGVNGNCQGRGTITLDTWKNIPGRLVSDIPLNTQPTSTKEITLFEIDPDTDDNYGSRIRGYVVAPATGMYTFWIASDDHGELWLSTDENPANKKKIANVEGWTPYRNWNFRNGQESAPIKLEACKRYYIEALQKDDAAGDNLSVGWRLPDGSLERPIPGARLLPYYGEADDCKFVLRNGRALDIGSGGGQTYVVGTNRALYQRSGNNWRFLSSDVALNRVDATGNGTAWGISTTNGIHYYSPAGWVKTNGAGKDVGADGTTVCVVGMNDRIYMRNGNGWRALTNKAALRVDVRDGNPWIVGKDGYVYQYHNNRWLKKGDFKARDIAVMEGALDVWALSQATGEVYRYKLNGVWEKVPGAADHISVSNDGTVWVVNRGTRIYERVCTEREFNAPQASFVGVDEVLEESAARLSMYPNPVSDVLTLEWEDADNRPDTYEVRIMDLTGKTVFMQQFSTEISQVNVSQLAKGVYTVVVRGGEVMMTERIVKVN